MRAAGAYSDRRPAPRPERGEDSALPPRHVVVSAGSKGAGKTMKQFRRRKNLLRALVLGFATTAIVATGAQARVSNYNLSAHSARDALNHTYTPQAMKALALRSEAMNQRYQIQAYQNTPYVRGLELRSE